MSKQIFTFLLFSILFFTASAENGYNLWLRYAKVNDSVLLEKYSKVLDNVSVLGNSATLDAVQSELNRGINGLIDKTPQVNGNFTASTTVLIGKASDLAEIANIDVKEAVKKLGAEGFLITHKKNQDADLIVITANTDIGVLYGSFRFLNLLQEHSNTDTLNLTSVPKIEHRVLNHWDNLDRTIERGFAGFSIWDWHKLPDYIDPRYIDYARANASIGINGTVVTNVNANALVLTAEYIQKLEALAGALRPYGIQVYLTARFSAPKEIGGLETADPLDKDVQQWWKAKAKEIYAAIPDFGGFLVKANSEGQPGPQDYNRTHADGANMLADAVGPYGGIVMWRAFVYSHEVPDDRAKQAYNEFKPLDGKFRKNVLIQVKNGPIDFQPREPFHPLFGAMPETPLMMEFQITQEYTGDATHLFYEAPLFKEVLDADTYAKGKGSTVAKIIEGKLDNHSTSGIAGVANIGNEINWCGHPFAQANWYAYGRLAWNPDLSSGQIAEEWLKMTFTTNKTFIDTAETMMLSSREDLVNYMTPLGLHHIMARNHHYGPGPWVTGGRPDWTAVYYHKADENGVGFDRSKTGSDAVSQYFPEVANKFNDLKTCPEEYLLWFHHVPWTYKLKSGNTLWDELCYHYYDGVQAVVAKQKQWETLKPYIDNDRFVHVRELLKIQAKEAAWWRDACVLYFQQFSGMPIPEGLSKPDHDLNYYESIQKRYVPGIRER